MNKTAWVAISILAIIGVVVVILSTGGDPLAPTADQVGDVSVGEGENPPPNPSLADVKETSVHRESNGDVVLEVTMANPVPTEGADALSLRWDLSENGEDTWMVTSNFDNGPVAAISSFETNFGASTIDSTLPGSIAVVAETVTITLKAGEIDGFPSAFSWRVTATLDADRADPASAVATDAAPDSGLGELE